MSDRAEKVLNAITSFSDSQKESALQFLVGFDFTTAETIIRWVLITYPEECTAGVTV